MWKDRSVQPSCSCCSQGVGTFERKVAFLGCEWIDFPHVYPLVNIIRKFGCILLQNTKKVPYYMAFIVFRV